MSTRGGVAIFEDTLGSLLIDGSWRPARGGRSIEVVSPVEGAGAASVAAAGPEDLRDAVDAARRAFDQGPWPQMSGRARAQILYDAADLVEEEAGRLARCQAVEMGKPVRYGERDDVPFAAMALRFFAALASRGPGFNARANPFPAKTALREPLGVVAALPGFHHPLAMAAAILAPALAVGDTVVLRPPAAAPLSVLGFAGLCHRAGLPPGVLNVVTGDGESAVGLAGHPGVDKVVYIGGAAQGRSVAKACAEGPVPVDLDIGRPAVHVVFDDACFERSARLVVQALLPGRAELRAAGARILIHESVYREFCKLLVALARELPPADPRDPATRLGPMAGREECDRLAHYLEWSRRRGARSLPGPSEADADAGLCRSLRFLEAPDSTVADALPEVLAPFAFVAPFRDPEHAVSLANAVPGMQSCTVYTADIQRAHLVVDSVRSEICRISTCNDEPLQGGWPDEDDEEAGGQLRELDIETVYRFTRQKAVWVQLPF